MAIKKPAAKHAVTKSSATKLTAKQALVAYEVVVSKIAVVRGQRVMFAPDLAELYGVETKVLMQAVKRNFDRFPVDFMFSLTEQEFTSLRSQFVTSNVGRGGRRYAPYAFTEHGAIMAATLLNSPRATEISVHVVRAFVELRDLVAGNRTLTTKLTQLERKVASHDESITGLIDSMRQLLAPPDPPKRSIGFVLQDEAGKTGKTATTPPRAKRARK